MKLPEHWLREWVNPPADAAAVAERLNLAGLECEVEPPPPLPGGVVVARIISLEPHPQAERLRVCQVDAGTGAPLTIVCGAANARAGMLAPAALPGARLPDGKEIGKAALRGVESAGMLCSAAELGLAEKSEGLLELDAKAKPGTPIETYLKLDDRLFNLELTPNRGDCLSIAGLARELAALYGVQQLPQLMRPAVVCAPEALEVVVEDAEACPRYLGRAITRLEPTARTPDWMRERLRRCGIRSIHPMVDITNYVMLELGQPMHAFDYDKLKGRIRVRRARAGEKLALLNEQTVTLDPEDLVIADDTGPVALAGVMGGTPTAVTEGTTRVFLEAACFNPAAVAATGRRHKLLSDSRYRFERGVDPALQRRALDRATILLQQISGGGAAGKRCDPGPIVEVGRAPNHGAELHLRHARIERLLGIPVPARGVPALLARLSIETQADVAGTWRVRTPTWRCDLRLEADLVEEVGRLHGYEHIPSRPYPVALAPFVQPETRRPVDALKDSLVARGWQEVITYSFVDPKLQSQLDPGAAVVALDNPIAETMGVMRSTLWTGLLGTWIYNRQRQHKRARLFEAGACYAAAGEGTAETSRLGGLAAGSALPEQWGSQPGREVDYFDLKGELEALLGPAAENIRFERGEHPALHPGRSAQVMRDGKRIGWLGVLHPRLVQTLDLPESVVLFEIEVDAAAAARLPAPQPVPEFPSSRRDLSPVIKESVSGEELLAAVRASGGALLKSVHIFDIYRGPGLAEGCKSISLGLIFQDNSRTLSLEEVDAAVAVITAAVTAQLGASFRG